MWKMYRCKEQTKGYWMLGIAKGRYSFTVDLGKWSWTIYKDDF